MKRRAVNQSNAIGQRTQAPEPTGECAQNHRAAFREVIVRQRPSSFKQKLENGPGIRLLATGMSEMIVRDERIVAHAQAKRQLAQNRASPLKYPRFRAL
jgi:hypothetical protein